MARNKAFVKKKSVVATIKRMDGRFEKQKFNGFERHVLFLELLFLCIVVN